MRPLKKAALGASLATLLSGVMAIPAFADPAGFSAAEPSPHPAAIAPDWKYSGPYSTLEECNIARQRLEDAGYNVHPDGCYLDAGAYYFPYN